MRSFLILFAAVANLTLVDAVMKEIAVARFKGAAAISVIPGIFDLAYVENRGCAWGMFQGHVWPLAAFGVLAFGVLVWKRRQVFYDSAQFRVFGRRPGVLAEPLLYAGIIGNLIDRVFRGCVIDFFDFHWGVHHFPCFNLADAYISAATCLLVIASIGNFRRALECEDPHREDPHREDPHLHH